MNTALRLLADVFGLVRFVPGQLTVLNLARDISNEDLLAFIAFNGQFAFV